MVSFLVPQLPLGVLASLAHGLNGNTAVLKYVLLHRCVQAHRQVAHVRGQVLEHVLRQRRASPIRRFARVAKRWTQDPLEATPRRFELQQLTCPPFTAYSMCTLNATQGNSPRRSAHRTILNGCRFEVGCVAAGSATSRLTCYGLLPGSTAPSWCVGVPAHGLNGSTSVLKCVLPHRCVQARRQFTNFCGQVLEHVL